MGELTRSLKSSVAGAVHVFIATSPFRQNDRQHAPSATLPLPRPSEDTLTIVSAAVQALRSIYRPGHRYAKAGVMLVDLQSARPSEGATPDLFLALGEPAPPLRRARWSM